MTLDDARAEVAKTLRPREEVLATPTTSGPCSMCQHFSMAGVDPKLKAGGWGICKLGSDIAGHYQSQAASCQFEPSRFKAQPPVDEATEERAAIVSEGCGVDQNEGLARARAMQPAPCDLPEEIDFG